MYHIVIYIYMLYYIYNVILHHIYVWLTLVLPQLFSQRAVLASVVRPFTASNALPFIRWLCHGRWVRAANLPNRIQTCQTCVAHPCAPAALFSTSCSGICSTAFHGQQRVAIHQMALPSTSLPWPTAKTNQRFGCAGRCGHHLIK